MKELCNINMQKMYANELLIDIIHRCILDFNYVKMISTSFYLQYFHIGFCSCHT